MSATPTTVPTAPLLQIGDWVRVPADPYGELSEHPGRIRSIHVQSNAVASGGVNLGPTASSWSTTCPP